MTERANSAIFWFLKLFLRSIFEEKSAWLPSMCKTMSALLPLYVLSKECKFAPHLEGSNADFAPHMEGSHANFAPHMERRHSFRDQQIAKIAISAYFNTYILKIYMIYVTTFEEEKKNIF